MSRHKVKFASRAGFKIEKAAPRPEKIEVCFGDPDAPTSRKQIVELSDEWTIALFGNFKIAIRKT